MVHALVLLGALASLTAPDPGATAPCPPPPIETDPCMLVESLLSGDLAAAEELPLWGMAALDAMAHGFQSRPSPAQQVALIDALATIGPGALTRDARPYLYSADPDIATAATRALVATHGPRAAGTLEGLARSTRPFAQRLAAIEALRDLGLKSSFAALAEVADDEGADPVLRAEAARSLPGLDRPRSRKWLRSLRLTPTANAFFAAEIDRMMAEDAK